MKKIAENKTLSPEQSSAAAVIEAMRSAAVPDKAKGMKRFFKTGPGGYGEGDMFLGIVNPSTRVFAKSYSGLPLSEIKKLLKSKWHEIRLCGLLIAVARYAKADDAGKEEIFSFYLENTAGVNNWDLVDLSAPGIAGEYFFTHSREKLYSLAESRSLWEQRIAMVSTLALIRHGDLDDTFRLAEKFFTHPHDLMHKAAGWMLREAGKRDRARLTDFLNRNKSVMPRTSLRYAIERYPESERKAFLKK